MKRLPLLLTLLALVFLAVSATYWGMQLYKPQQRQIAATPPAGIPEPSADAAATLFGGQAATAVVTNYQLTGIVAAGRDSVAILVADGQPPKALTVGKEIAPGVTISEVHPRYVMLSDGGVMKRIELAPDTKPAVPLSGAAMPAAMPQQQPEPMAETPQVEPQTAPGAVRPPPPPGEVDPVVGPNEEPPQETPPSPAAANYNGAVQGNQPMQGNQSMQGNQPPPPPAQPQMPPPTRVMGGPAAGQPVTQ
jgi:general secretion pathway protein C